MAEAVLYVRDLDRMAAFYAGCLGLDPVESGDDHRGLHSADWTLWLVRAGAAAAPAAPSSPPPRRSQVPVKLVFEVPDLDAARSRAAALGGAVDDRARAFAGLTRCDAVDPEGNVIQVGAREP